jgi:hypothetical protein
MNTWTEAFDASVALGYTPMQAGWIADKLTRVGHDYTKDAASEKARDVCLRRLGTLDGAQAGAMYKRYYLYYRSL